MRGTALIIQLDWIQRLLLNQPHARHVSRVVSSQLKRCMHNLPNRIDLYQLNVVVPFSINFVIVTGQSNHDHI